MLNEKSIAEIRVKGVERIIPTSKGKDSILIGIQFMSQFEIIIDERCFKTIEEFDNYTWTKDKKTGEYMNKPVDTYNHCIDAIRYAVSKLIFKNNEDNTNVYKLKRTRLMF